MLTHRLTTLACAAAVAASIATIATTATAQNVTLSGVADIAARVTKNEGRDAIKSLTSGGNSTSRLAFRGTEDLGGGLGVGFWLEHGLLLGTGTSASSTQFWDRRSTGSLTHGAFGELRAGRDFVPSYATGAATTRSATSALQAPTTWFRRARPGRSAAPSRHRQTRPCAPTVPFSGCCRKAGPASKVG